PPAAPLSCLSVTCYTDPAPPFFSSSFFSTTRPPPRSPLFPYTTLFRSSAPISLAESTPSRPTAPSPTTTTVLPGFTRAASAANQDRKSTRLNSSHVKISYAVFCLKKKNADHHVVDGELVALLRGGATTL